MVGYGNVGGYYKLCRRARRLSGGVCKDCLERPGQHRKASCELRVRVVLINAEAITKITETLDEIRQIHEENPWLGLHDLANTIGYQIKELRSEPS